MGSNGGKVWEMMGERICGDWGRYGRWGKVQEVMGEGLGGD